MLDTAADFTKTFLIPGSPVFFLIAMTAVLLFAWSSRRFCVWALPTLTVLAMSYWLASLPRVSDLLSTRFDLHRAEPSTLADMAGARAIVVLGAGASAYAASGRVVTIPTEQTVLNALEAIRVSELFAHRLPVIASGGTGNDRHHVGQDPESVLMRDLMVRGGVPAAAIMLESASLTTRDQARLVAPILKSQRWLRFVLIAPPVHMPRAKAVFEAQGVEPIPAPSRFRSDSPGRGLPAGSALDASARATYDYLAWSYYWMRGWLAAPPPSGL